MSSLAITAIVFSWVFCGALLGMFLRAKLPEDHLSAASRDVVKLAMGTIATMTAVVLGLLVASAKGYYDTQSRELTEMSAKIILIDRVLAHYGPEAKDARDLLRASVVGMIDKLWPKGSSPPSKVELGGAGEAVYDRIQDLSPQNEVQRSLQARALGLSIDIGQTRLLMFEQASSSVSMPLLLLVVFSLSITFASFSLHASPNSTVVVTLVLCALAVSGTLFVILEMYSPFHGLIQIPSDQLRDAVAHLGH